MKKEKNRRVWWCSETTVNPRRVGSQPSKGRHVGGEARRVLWEVGRQSTLEGGGKKVCREAQRVWW